MYTFVGLVLMTGLGSVFGVEFSEAQESRVARMIAMVVIVDVYVFFILFDLCSSFTFLPRSLKTGTMPGPSLRPGRAKTRTSCSPLLNSLRLITRARFYGLIVVYFG